MPKSSRRTVGSASGVTSRLVALVMIPVTVMGGLSIAQVVSRGSMATAAVEVERGVAKLSALVELDGAVEAQQFLESFDVRFAELGTTPATASGLLGLDLGAEVGTARSQAADALAVLGPAAPIDAGELAALNAGIDSGKVSPAAAVTRLSALQADLGVAVVSGVDQLEADARITRADPLLAALQSLQVVNGLVDVAAPEGLDLSAVWFPAVGESPQAALARLSADAANYASASTELRQSGVTGIVAGLSAIATDPLVRDFGAAVTTVLAGGPFVSKTAAGLPSPPATNAFEGYLDRAVLLNGLALRATAEVRIRALGLAASEHRAFLAWAALGALLALASVAVAVGFARSIARPLRDLAGYAHAVNEGRLDADPPRPRHRAPREIRVAVSTFTDLVANLALLDAKANALASCTFDDPVLSQPLPGRLGRSLENSVAVLSGSIVERDRLQIHLAHQATHDSLTGIANRAAAVAGIQDAMYRAARNGEAMALLFVDLNDFKSVNDRYGHEMGDEVLRQVSLRLTDCAGAGDLVARLGGDEFVVVSERITGVDRAMDLAHRVISGVTRPIDLGQVSVTVGAAVGVAMTLDGPEDPLRLLARADAAMYRAKHHDRSAIEMFDVVLQGQLVEREDVERALAQALAAPDGGGLLLHFQPIFTTATGAIAGVEALVRWNRPGRGFLPPDAFVPIAESTSLIIDLDRWVLAEVGRHLLAWSDDRDLAHVPVAVNISGRHLQSGELARHLATLLARTGIEPSRLEIEITETVLLDDLVVAAAELDAVRGLGVRVAIDDFGTGYTSLAPLQHLPIDSIKIDRSLVSQLNRRRGSSIVRMVIDLGHAIDLVVIAEGVETEAEQRALADMGADYVQGYLRCGPLSAVGLKTWVHDQALVGPSARPVPIP